MDAAHRVRPLEAERGDATLTDVSECFLMLFIVWKVAETVRKN